MVAPITTADAGKAVGGFTGHVAVVSNSELLAAEQAAQEQKAREANTVGNEPISRLAAHVMSCWSEARNARDSAVRERLLDCRRRRRGEYSTTKLEAIRKTGGSEVFVHLTKEKCLAALAWINDVLSPQNGKPWTIVPTPVPELPPEVQSDIVDEAMEVYLQAQLAGQPLTPEQVFSFAAELADGIQERSWKLARQAADRMEKTIEDQLVEGRFYHEFQRFLDDFVTYPTAFLRGHVVRRRKALTWAIDKRAGKWVPVVQDALVQEFERVSPFDMFPAPNATNISDGYLIERSRLSRYELTCMKGVDGYSADEIDKVLAEAGGNALRGWASADEERPPETDESASSVGGESDDGRDGTVEALDFWGTVSGAMLKEWGMEVEDETAEYDVNCLVVTSHVVKAVLNPDPLGRRPYYAASYEQDPDSIWGTALPERMADVQDSANATMRSLINNLAISSLPQFIITDINRLPPGTNVTAWTPGKVWQFTDLAQNGAKPLDVLNIPNNAKDLLETYLLFKREADDTSGIPPYSYGNDMAAGAGKTASGLAMLMNSAARGIKRVIVSLDQQVIEPMIERLYVRNMMYSDDETIKGDCKVNARGVMELLVREQTQIRRQEFLTATLNPIDSQIVGPEGRAALLREQAKALDMDVDRIVPPEDVVQRRLAAAQQQAQQTTAGLPPGSGQAGAASEGQESTSPGRGEASGRPPVVRPEQQAVPTAA